MVPVFQGIYPGGLIRGCRRHLSHGIRGKAKRGDRGDRCIQEKGKYENTAHEGTHAPEGDRGGDRWERMISSR